MKNRNIQCARRGAVKRHMTSVREHTSHSCEFTIFICRSVRVENEMELRKKKKKTKTIICDQIAKDFSDARIRRITYVHFQNRN